MKNAGKIIIKLRIHEKNTYNKVERDTKTQQICIRF